jgi:hypothetical protein
MDIQEMKKRAKRVLIENRMDKLLLSAFEEVGEYQGALKEPDDETLAAKAEGYFSYWDFDGWNIGINDLSMETDQIEDQKESPIILICGNLLDIQFKIGGTKNSFFTPSGDVSSLRIRFYCKDKCTIDLIYYQKDDYRSGNPYPWYELAHVEEYHASKETIKVLMEIDRLIKLRSENRKREIKEEEEKKYKEKFSF